MVRTHILLLSDCMGRFIKFRPTINEEEIAEEKILLVQLQAFYKLQFLLVVLQAFLLIFYFTSSFIVFGDV